MIIMRGRKFCEVIWRSRADELVCKLSHEIRIDLEGLRYFVQGMLQGWR